MLIEFSVSNFRSIRDRETFSMIAKNTDKNLPGHILETKELPGIKNLTFLSAAAIYGANASGKSNILYALHTMQQLVNCSFTSFTPGEELPIEPFIFDPDYKDSPSEFEVVFYHDEVRFRYGFSLTYVGILSEWLYSYPEGYERTLFEREYNESSKNNYTYKFGSHFGSHRDIDLQTRANALLISVGAQLNHEVSSVIYKWFKDDVSIYNLAVNGGLDHDFTSFLIDYDKNIAEFIRDLMQTADLGISSLKVEDMSVDSEEDLKFKVEFHHSINGEDFSIPLNLSDESAGTVRYYSLLGPILYKLLYGGTMFIDEIGASLHPALARELIKLFGNPENNPNGAQLVFTTHDTSLLDTDLLRRDQFWFTEKDNEGATHLTPLTDFKPRENEALQKGYLAGRYGAVPFFAEELKLYE